MKKNLLSLCTVLLALLGVASLPSCNSKDDTPDWTDYTMQDIVTLTGATDKGFSVVFRKENDSPLVTLTFSGDKQRIDTAYVKVGQRFLLAYYPESGLPYVSGPATAYGYSPIPNVKMTYGTRDGNQSWMSEEMRVLALWRTGNWINLNCTVPMKQTYKKLALVVDEETKDSEIPTAYMLYLSDNSVEATSQQLIATFDIAEIWNSDKYKGLNVVVANAAGPHRFQFHKEGQEVIKPTE
ncbi:MAG: hypothetical protein K2K84_04245 [Muribaculaceae bacterium]|nr:hypothetical protein [Muribaculaceae bacterium]